MWMFVEIHGPDDLTGLEDAIRKAIGAERIDVSIFRSRPYVDLRQRILKGFESEQNTLLYETVYFASEMLVLRVVGVQPLLVWCGYKDVAIYKKS